LVAHLTVIVGLTRWLFVRQTAKYCLLMGLALVPIIIMSIIIESN
jgi:hypothetical protein